MGIKVMIAGEDTMPLMVQARQTVCAVKSMKAIYDGDAAGGLLFTGWNVGAIRDVFAGKTSSSG